MQAAQQVSPRTSYLKVHTAHPPTNLRVAPLLSTSAAQAFNEGFEAAFNGGDELGDNRYDWGSDEFYSFNDGFAYWFEHESETRKERALAWHQQLLTALGEDPVLAKLERTPIERVGALIGIPVEHWPGKCYEVACALIRAFNWGARAAPVYGLFKGHISPDCTRFAGVARHGWIQLQDGRMVDPTRWVFRAKPPAIEVFVPGSDEFDQAREDYDEGAQALAVMTEMPVFEPDQKSFEIPEVLAQLLRRQTGSVASASRLNAAQLGWLARTAAAHLSIRESHEVLRWYKTAGLDALLPVDFVARTTRLLQWGPHCFEVLSE